MFATEAMQGCCGQCVCELQSRLGAEVCISILLVRRVWLFLWKCHSINVVETFSLLGALRAFALILDKLA